MDRFTIENQRCSRTILSGEEINRVSKGHAVEVNPAVVDFSITGVCRRWSTIVDIFCFTIECATIQDHIMNCTIWCSVVQHRNDLNIAAGIEAVVRRGPSTGNGIAALIQCIVAQASDWTDHICVGHHGVQTLLGGAMVR